MTSLNVFFSPLHSGMQCAEKRGMREEKGFIYPQSPPNDQCAFKAPSARHVLFSGAEHSVGGDNHHHHHHHHHLITSFPLRDSASYMDLFDELPKTRQSPRPFILRFVLFSSLFRDAVCEEERNEGGERGLYTHCSFR